MAVINTGIVVIPDTADAWSRVDLRDAINAIEQGFDDRVAFTRTFCQKHEAIRTLEAARGAYGMKALKGRKR